MKEVSIDEEESDSVERPKDKLDNGPPLDEDLNLDKSLSRFGNSPTKFKTSMQDSQNDAALQAQSQELV